MTNCKKLEFVTLNFIFWKDFMVGSTNNELDKEFAKLENVLKGLPNIQKVELIIND